MSVTVPSSVFDDVDAGATHYTASLVGISPSNSGVPADPKLIEGWLAKNLGITDPEQLRTWTLRHITEVQGIDPGEASDEQIEQAIEAAAEKRGLVYKRTPDGLPYIEGRCAKAMLKEAVAIAYPKGEHKWGSYASRARDSGGRQVGGKAPLSYLAERVFVVENAIVLTDDPDAVRPDLAVGHIKDEFKGTRSTLTYFEVIDEWTADLTVRVIDDCITPEQWARIWKVAENIGFGSRRSQGAGRFVVTRWDRID